MDNRKTPGHSVGLGRFELPTSCPPDKRANQAAPQPGRVDRRLYRGLRRAALPSCDGRFSQRRGTRGCRADEPRPAAVRGSGRDEASVRRLSRRDARPDPAGVARSPALGDPGDARSGTVHAEERAEARPGLADHHSPVGGGFQAHRVVRLVQRPPHALVVRQPTRDRVPPDAWSGGPSGPSDASRARHRSTGGSGLRALGQRRED